MGLFGSLPTGDLVNQLIAEIVFGLKNIRQAYRVDYPSHCSIYDLGEKPEDDDATLCWVYDDMDSDDTEVLPDYTASIHHAYLILGQFPAPEWQIEIMRNGGSEKWTCLLRSYDQSELGCADTLPLAICRAAISVKVNYGK